MMKAQIAVDEKELRVPSISRIFKAVARDSETLRVSTSSLLQRLDGDWWRVLLIWIVVTLVRYGLFCLLVFSLLAQSSAQAQPVTKKPFCEGEVLCYKVKWSFMRLGTVVIRQKLLDPGDPSRYLLEMSVKSAELPFINVQFVNRSILSTLSSSVQRETIISGNDETVRTVYWYDPTSETIFTEDSAHGTLVRRDTLARVGPCFDALGLFMIARKFSGSALSLSLPTLNDYEIKSTDVTVSDGVEEIEVEALSHPVRSRRIDGNANWVGKSFAGMKGAFRGWISDDEASVPLRAEVKIFLGSIVLELESYERTGWQQTEAPAKITSN